MEYVKIYIPDVIFFSAADQCALFGHVQVHTNSKTATFYIVSSTAIQTASLKEQISPVGRISSIEPIKKPTSDEPCLSFYSSGRTNLILDSVSLSDGVSERCHYQIITYDHRHLSSISIDISAKRRRFDEEISQLIDVFKKANYPVTGSCWKNVVERAQNTVKRCSARGSRVLNECGSLFPAIRHTAVFQHLICRHLMMGRFDVKTFCTITMDVVLGLVVMLLLLYLGHPYIQLTNYTETIVIQVQHLLRALKGFPIGLKLNIELNNFFLDIFTYHIDLWVTFLVLVSPIIKWFFVPFVVLGMFGLSFQLAMMSDLLVFISLHAHCFYIYVAVLYHIEIVAINNLWRVLLGSRMNPLKGRVETHEYSHPQLYLATLFFAALLFLLPTVLLYYVVFAFLRFCVYCLTYVLITIQRYIMTFPIYSVACHAMRICVNTSNVELSIPETIDRAPRKTGALQPSIMRMRFHPSGVESDRMPKPNGELPEMLTIAQFFMGLIRGQVMGFILPLSKAD